MGGIKGFDDWKFWLALLLYGLSVPLFFENSLSWNAFNVLMPALISFIIVASIAWDYRVIGSPRHPFCLILHFAFFVAVIFALNRLMLVGDFTLPRSGIPTVTGYLADAVKNLPLVGDLYRLFNLVLKSLGYAVIMLLVSFAIMFSRKVALALLAIFAVAFVAFSVGQNLNPNLWSLFAGLGCLVVAFWLQREDEQKYRFWNQVADRLANSPPRLRADMKLQIAALRRLNASGALNEREIRGVAAGVMGCDSSDPRLRDVCMRLLDQLISQEGLAEARDGNQGKRLVLLLGDEASDFFANCARLVRIIVTLGFCIVYILSPIDLIPDATPVFGVADDMAIGVIGLLSSVKTANSLGRREERRLANLPFNL